MSLLDWSRLILLSVLWGGTFFLVEIALGDVGPFTIVLTRVALAAAVLAAYCRIAGLGATWTPGLIAGLAVMGLINNAIPFSLITWGQTHITGSLASIFNATTPLFTVAVAHLWPGADKATALKLAGVAAGLAGVATLIGLGSLADLGGDVPGEIACLGAALSYAVALVFARRFRAVHPLVLSAGMLASATVFMLPLAFALETPYRPFPPVSALAAMLALAVFAAAFAYYLYFSVLRSAGPTNASLVTFMIPASAILLGVAFLGEVVEPRHLAGLGLILLGLALVDGRLFRQRQTATPSRAPAVRRWWRGTRKL